MSALYHYCTSWASRGWQGLVDRAPVPVGRLSWGPSMVQDAPDVQSPVARWPANGRWRRDARALAVGVRGHGGPGQVGAFRQGDSRGGRACAGAGAYPALSEEPGRDLWTAERYLARVVGVGWLRVVGAPGSMRRLAKTPLRRPVDASLAFDRANAEGLSKGHPELVEGAPRRADHPHMMCVVHENCTAASKAHRGGLSRPPRAPWLGTLRPRTPRTSWVVLVENLHWA
jgi:hypothetical protein